MRAFEYDYYEMPPPTGEQAKNFCETGSSASAFSCSAYGLRKQYLPPLCRVRGCRLLFVSMPVDHRPGIPISTLCVNAVLHHELCS